MLFCFKAPENVSLLYVIGKTVFIRLPIGMGLEGMTEFSFLGEHIH